jgi:Replication-relaxation
MNLSVNHPHSPTNAERKAVVLLAEYFCLNAELAARLTGTSERTVRRHLQYLEDKGYVQSLPYYPEHQKKGAAPHAFGLSDKGVDYAFKEGFNAGGTKTFDEHSSRTIDHELTITRFHVALKNLCAAKGWRLRWRQYDLKHGVHPDALFSINDTYWFLEVERAKLGNYKNGEPQILRKLKTYHDYYDSTSCEKDWGDFKKFRVLTLMRTRERTDNLIALLEAEGLGATFWNAPESTSDFSIPVFHTSRSAQPIAFDAVV